MWEATDRISHRWKKPRLKGATDKGNQIEEKRKMMRKRMLKRRRKRRKIFPARLSKAGNLGQNDEDMKMRR